MDSCTAVDREIDKLLRKYESFENSSENSLEDLIEYVKSVKQGMCEAPEETILSPLQSHILSACVKKVKESVAQISTDHKELHGHVSKIGKAIDRHFVSDFKGTIQENVFAGNKIQLLNESICEHLLRQGQVDVAESLVDEAKISVDFNQKEPFSELNRILEECGKNNLGPALRWAESRHEDLIAHGSSIEFKLHRLKFLGLLQEGFHKEALAYSRKFSVFKDQAREIQRLMGCFAYVKTGISLSPYADLFDPVNWLEINELLAKDVCSLLGLSMSSPLEVSISAGCIAVPTLLQIKQVMQQQRCAGVWNSKDELPVEVDLGNDFRYHSIFACPILRQQCGHTNPPMRLICGHAISKDALNKLVNGNRLKCPYCPIEMDPKDACQLRF